MATDRADKEEVTQDIQDEAQRAVAERLVELSSRGTELPKNHGTVMKLVVTRLRRALKQSKVQEDRSSISAWCRADTCATALRVRYMEDTGTDLRDAARRRYTGLGFSPEDAEEWAGRIEIRYYESGPSTQLGEHSTESDVSYVTLAWLKTVTLNDALNRRRRGWRVTAWDDADCPADEVTAAGGPQGAPPPAPDKLVEARNMLDRIADLVPTLQRRVALVASDMLAHPDDEPAERALRLNLTPGNIHTQTYRFRQALAAADLCRRSSTAAVTPEDPDDGPGGAGRGRKTMSARDTVGKDRAAKSQRTAPRTQTPGGATGPGPAVDSATGQARLLAEAARVVGDLVLSGQRVDAEALASEARGARGAVEAALEATDGALIDEAMPGLAETGAWLAAHPDPATLPNEVAEASLAVLERRHHVEALLLGAEQIVGRRVASMDLATSLEAFDTAGRETLWAFVPLNSARRARAAALDPEARERCWWWSEGADLAEDSVLALRKAARLIAVFPAAQGELDALIAAARETRAEAMRTTKGHSARRMASRGSPERSAPGDKRLRVGDMRVTTAAGAPDNDAERLGVVYFLQFRAVPGHDNERLVAHGSEEEVVVRPLDGVTLSVDDDALIIDYEMSCDPDPSRPPVLEPERGAIIVATEPFTGRFVLPFQSMDTASTTAILRVPRRDQPDLVVQIPWEVP